MLNDAVVGIGVEEVTGDPLALAVVEVLVGMQENERPILYRPDDPNVVDRTAFRKRLETFCEALRTVRNAGRMLRIALSCMRVEGFPGSAILYSLQV